MVLGGKTRYSTSCHFTEDSGRLHAPAALPPATTPADILYAEVWIVSCADIDVNKKTNNACPHLG